MDLSSFSQMPGAGWTSSLLMYVLIYVFTETNINVFPGLLYSLPSLTYCGNTPLCTHSPNCNTTVLYCGFLSFIGNLHCKCLEAVSGIAWYDCVSADRRPQLPWSHDDLCSRATKGISHFISVAKRSLIV